MKFEKALSLLTVLALHQLAFCQEDETSNDAEPTLPALNTDIFWWKSVINQDQISNYITE
ncbi:hypothetical protein CU097_002330, partial [Rhizopus azygosporus]